MTFNRDITTQVTILFRILEFISQHPKPIQSSSFSVSSTSSILHMESKTDTVEQNSVGRMQFTFTYYNQALWLM